MMQPQIHAFVQTAAEIFGVRGPLYEFSYCPNGMPPAGSLDPRPTEPSADGPEPPPSEFDRLEDLQQLPFPDGAAGAVVCIDALEHVFEPRRAAAEMIRILAPGGMLLLASSVGHSPVERADPYWRPTPRAIERLLDELEATLVAWQGSDPSPHTVFGLGFKAPAPDRFLACANRFFDRFQARLAEADAAVGWWCRLRRLVATCAQTKHERRRSRDHHRVQLAVHLPVDRRLSHQLLASCLPEEKTGTRLDLSQ